jgi:hypothetical protein
MKHILDRLTANFNERLKGLEVAFEKHKDWEVLKRTLNLRSQSCYKLFGVGNTTLEDVEYLFALFINCFLDDSTMVIKKITNSYYEVRHFTYGDDDYIGIRESEMLEVLSLIERYEECYDENDKFIDNDQGKHYYSLVRAVKAKIKELETKQEETKWR